MISLPIFRQLRRLRRETGGSAITEFGIVAPVFLMLLLAMFDLAHMSYAKAVFKGVVERAAREASLEGTDTGEADQMVEERMRTVLPGVELHAERKSYFDFADIDRHEEFTDGNGNNVCDAGEGYVDENNSGGWDADIGATGNGGSGDVVVYTVKATYEPVFKVPFMPKSWGSRTLEASAVKKNQPFGNQQNYVTTARTCTE